jgi:lipopolysaccharide export system permease protein
MSLIDRYVIREILKFFSIILIAIVGIFLAVDFFEKFDDFVDAGLSFSRAMTFFGLRIPFIVSQMTPVGLLLSILIVFGLMSKHNELIALRSGGVSAFYLLRTVLGISVVFAVLLFFLTDQVVPTTFSKANHIWTQEVKNRPGIATRKRNIWIKGHRSIAHIKHYNHRNKTISGITLYYFDDQFRLVRRVDAKSAAYTEEQWVFSDLMEQNLLPGAEEEHYRVSFRDRHAEPFDYLPEDFHRVAKKSEELNIFELLSYIRAVEAEGYDATNYRVDLHAKLAFPLICLILSMLAAGYGIRQKRRGGHNLSMSIAYGLGVTFIYTILYNFCLSLGYGEMLPPFIAAWIANFIFLSYAVLVSMKVEY